MSNSEIKGLFFWRQHHWLPCGLNIKEKLWWRFMPGTVINVRWPKGQVVVQQDDPRWDWTMGASRQLYESADPNDHYRPWLEEHIGKQGRDWNWGMSGSDATENRLTIKIRQSKAHYASYLALKW